MYQIYALPAIGKRRMTTHSNAPAPDVTKTHNHVAVTYTDGTSEVFDAVQVTDRGLYICRRTPDDTGQLITFGFIPRLSVKHVVTIP